MHLREWTLRSKTSRPLPRRACVITFDDGWLDNYEYAFPILKEEQVPATIFAVSHMIGTNKEFWPNRILRLLSLPQSIFERTSSAWLHEMLKSYGINPSRESVAQLLTRLKSRSDDEVESQLDAVEREIGIIPQPSPALLNWDQVREMKNSGLIDIGSHTCFHRRLTSALSNGQVESELVRSKKLIEEQLSAPVQLFCYPNGDQSSEATRLVRKHYEAAVTTSRGINSSSSDLYALKRVALHEDGSDDKIALRSRLSGWM